MNSPQPGRYGGAPTNATMSSYPNQQQQPGGGYHGGGPSYNQQQQLMSPHPEEYQENENSMTIDEMRILHRTALAEAEAKRTELRLVLASRYRELVGSSDEVIHMRERAEELNDLVVALPELVEKVAKSAEAIEDASSAAAVSGDDSRKLFSDESQTGAENEDGKNSPQDRDDFTTASGSNSLAAVRGEISRLPRDIHRCLDENNVHGAAAALIALFDIIASRSKYFPLATALSSGKNNIGIPTKNNNATPNNPPLLETQMKMVYLHVQTLPTRTVKLSRRALLQSAAKPGVGAHATAAALSALDLLDIDRRRQKKLLSSSSPVPSSSAAVSTSSSSTESSRATKLIDLYYDSKAQLLNKLLNRLTLPASVSAADATSVTNAAEVILSKIVLILQYDVILHPYQIFVLRKFPVNDNGGSGDDSHGGEGGVINEIMSTLPHFDADLLKSKASRFLAAHLPLIRTKVKSVLMIIAGTTASKLGQIRQTLYDKTDGVECMTALDNTGVCTWDEAVSGMVDIRVVSHGTTFATALDSNKGSIGENRGGGGGGMNGQSNTAGATATAATRRFSLWGALFSNTFSSLVHSLLTSSFHSVHVRVVSTLRTSLARAPPFESMLPHEAHRNALRIATDLDASLRRVSDDAHELLVHAEEREESERRLRQSLYVQTCEIMGRLLNELRRMLTDGKRGSLVRAKSDEEKEDATKVLIVGRLCHLLKFRLKSLPTLLDPKSSPAVLAAGLGGGKSSGMITLMELSSSFDLADDDDDGLISFDEAMEAMESAFSGTHFHGAQMVRDTLLLSDSSAAGVGEASSGVSNHASRSFASNTHKSAPQSVTLSELALLSARGLRHDASGPESALGTVQSSLDDIVHRCFREWARAALSPPLTSFATTLQEQIGVASRVSDMEWKRLNGLIDKEDDALLKEISQSKGDASKLKQSQAIVGEVSPHVVSYLLAVAGVLNRSVCPADSLPPVPSLEYAEALGISSSNNKEMPNMMVTIRGSLLGEALTSMSQSLRQEMTSSSDEEDDDDDHNILKKCSPSSLVQLVMDVKFINRCFFDRNQHGFLLASDSVDDSRAIMDSLTERLSISVSNALRDGSPVNSAISERH
ncbi:hypothetical protein ACHAXR_006032, partial [Thalassiosira sp. AJA248-18]